MNLIPNLSILIARDGKSFAFSDSTTVDNQSNSTNYWNGVTTRYNTNISLATTNSIKPDKIGDVTLFITDPTNTTYSFLDFDVPVSSTSKVILNTQIGQLNTIPDGVYKFEYILWNILSVTVSGASQQTTLTFSSLPASLEVGQYIKFNENDTLLYTIVSLNADANTIVVDQNLDTTYSSFSTIYVGYRYIKYFLFDYKASCCIDKAIATASDGCCNDCISESLTTASNLYILLLGAKAQVNNGLQTEAQATITTINSLCNGETVDCGC